MTDKHNKYTGENFKVFHQNVTDTPCEQMLENCLKSHHKKNTVSAKLHKMR